ncbi:MAG TPA: ABC transporter permease [Gemmatimonadaceae bacterium]|nr:ABC transporter permease [Gemmatimonadaceae bacterium]
MAKLWVVITREYLERVRSKWFIFMTIFGPVFMLAVFVLPGYMTMRGLKDAQVGRIHILDATGTGLGQRVASHLERQEQNSPLAKVPGAVPALPSVVEPVNPRGLAAAESIATRLVMEKQAQGYLILDSLTLRAHKVRYAGRNASSIAQMGLIESAVRQSLMASRMQDAGLAPARIDSLTSVKVDMTAERIDDRGRGGSGLVSAIFGVVIAILLYMMIMIYGQNVLRGVLEEKMTRVAEVVMASVKPDILLAGKILGVGAVGLTQQLIWFGSAALLFGYGATMAKAMGVPQMQGVTLPTISAPLFLALVFFFLFGYVLYSAMFAAVGAMVGSQEEAQQAAGPVVMLLVSSVIFIQPIMLNPSGTLAVTMSLIPFTAPIVMPLRMSAVQVPTYEIGMSLVGVALTCWLAIWASARIYRVGLLMTGKRPSLRELARWIKYA